MFTQNDLDWFLRPMSGSDKVARYPLTNIGIDSDETLHIEVAVAGFDKDDIEIELKGNYLIITGNIIIPEEKEDIRYIQEHISANTFSRRIVLNDVYLGGEIRANVSNGILTITIDPKEPVRKLIAIGE